MMSVKIYLSEQLHVHRKSECKQTGLIVLDEVIDFADEAWFRLAHR